MGSPYSALALIYDRLLGDSFFPLLRRNFEWLAQLHPIRPDSVADVACGTGTFVKYLCGRGIPQVIGVDRSPDMLEIALRKNRRNHSRFFCQDFLNLQLPKPVSLITCNFDSLNYLLNPDELFKTFQKFRANLKPGGCTVFDMITRNQPWHGLDPIIEKRRIGNLNFLRSMQLDRWTGMQCSRVVMASPIGIMRETHIQRAYPTMLVLRLLRKAGFRLLQVRDFADLEPVTRRSRRIMVIAVRP
jgi:SAM-dependent methyltransferase